MPDSPAVRRLLVVGTVAAVLVTGAVTTASAGDRTGGLLTGYDASFRQTTPTGVKAIDETKPHRHDDPATENAISRTGENEAHTDDPTSLPEKVANAVGVAVARGAAAPELTRARIARPRTHYPQNRYAMAGGCYRLVPGGEPLYFQATNLGHYLLYDADRRFVSTGGGKAATPSDRTVWRAVRQDRLTSFRNGSEALQVGNRTAFLLTRSSGCARYPEAQLNVRGAPFAGVSPFQEVRGYVDAHTHGMAFEFLGGGAHCGKPWDRFGAPYALLDCPDHVAGVNPLEALLSSKPYHDPVGWPTFKDWPAPDSLTHEGTYYRWMERAWRGGQRLFVNLLVENNQLCRLYPFPVVGKNSCNDMDSIRLQAQRMYELQDYVDAQWGGPGKGWYRIVTDPWQARRVINAGKLAVVMGIETSVPFGCSFTVRLGDDVPDARCTKRSIDQQLAEVRALGVRQMELVNKFDNALSGVAGDTGTTGVVVNTANKLETGTFWDMRHCDPEPAGAHDKNQYAVPDISAEQQDALFGAIGKVYGQLGALPIYPPPDHCNRRGLTDLGAHLVDRLADHGMLIDPDHMSVDARDSLLDQVEKRRYGGVISSHSWSTPDAYPRIYRLGGFIAPYAGDSSGFVKKWRRHLGWADDRYYFGFGFGADMNGLGAQGDPRGSSVPNPVTYPFRGLGGVRIGRQHAGRRVYDVNVDGVAQYGLYPDWIEDLRKIADAQRGDGDAIVADMARGAEAYLQTWERANGAAPDSCRNPRLRMRLGKFITKAAKDLPVRALMRRVGQPFLRRDLAFTYCARTRRDPDVRVLVLLTRDGRVRAVQPGD